MIFRLYLISLLLACAEPSHVSLVSQSRTNAGPYVGSSQIFTSPVTGETIVYSDATTQDDFKRLNDLTRKAVPFISKRVSSLQAIPCTDGLINIHIIPDKKLNDRSIMTFTKDEPAGKEFYGITTYVFPNIAWSFICSDCDKPSDDILIHELTHFYMAQCGIAPENQDESDCHDIVEEYRKSKTDTRLIIE